MNLNVLDLVAALKIGTSAVVQASSLYKMHIATKHVLVIGLDAESSYAFIQIGPDFMRS